MESAHLEENKTTLLNDYLQWKVEKKIKALFL